LTSAGEPAPGLQLGRKRHARLPAVQQASDINYQTGRIPVQENPGRHNARARFRQKLTRCGVAAGFVDRRRVEPREAGLAGYESSQWYGLLAPAGTPPEVLDLLNAQVANIMRSVETKTPMTSDGLVPIGGSRGHFAAHIRSEIEKWAKAIRASGARVD
jgi:hypothetical protein